MWQYNYSQPPDELMHYGKLGMKWGKRRALNSATKAGRYSATSKDVTKQGNAAIKIYNDRAKKSANKAAKTKSALKRMSLEAHSELNKQEVDAVKSKVKDHTAYYDMVAANKTKKAYKLAAKYGDAKTKAKVTSLIKENSSKPYEDLNRFDTRDPIVKGVESALAITTEALKANR